MSLDSSGCVAVVFEGVVWLCPGMENPQGSVEQGKERAAECSAFGARQTSGAETAASLSELLGGTSGACTARKEEGRVSD